METERKLSGKAKLSYALGAVGKDMVYMLSASYVLYYFQDLLGVNAIANTRWWAPAYSPDIGQFHLQTREEIGNAPYFDLFANIQWKRASIYVKYTNAFQEWPVSDYFSAYHYIKPVSGFKFGIHWPFYSW